MNKYSKIVTVWKRDPDNKYKTLIEGEPATPEFAYLYNLNWIFTEKIDGTNIRIMWEDEILRFGGRTDNAQIPVFLYDKLQDMFKPDFFTEFESVCLYGEGYGAKIQKGGGNYNPNGVSFILFDIRIGNTWLKREDVDEIGAAMALDVVPIVGEGTLLDAVKMTEAGFNSIYGYFQAEGLVMRPEVELLDRRGKRIITKVKFKDFAR